MIGMKTQDVMYEKICEQNKLILDFGQRKKLQWKQHPNTVIFLLQLIKVKHEPQNTKQTRKHDTCFTTIIT